MEKRVDINKWLYKLQTAFFALSFALALLPSSAKAILCGEYSCDTTTRKCVKLASPVCVKSYTSPGTMYGPGTTTCLKYEYYRCIGQGEPEPNGSTPVEKSINNEGKELSGEEEAKALGSAQRAPYTAKEEKDIVAAYYKAAGDVEFEGMGILEEVKGEEESKEGFFAQDDAQDAIDAITKLKDYANKSDGYYDGLRGIGDSNFEDTAQEARDKIKDLRDDGHMTQEQYDKLSEELDALEETISSRALNAAKATGNEQKAETAKEAIASLKQDYALRCPTIEQYRSRYQAGCWSCLVLEKLTSAFLHAADKGLHITQKAGILLLIIGSAIWFAFWALKNVSSFTEIQLGNILNDLFKFAFKVMIAYWFIVYSSTAISKYFITPIMSVGAIVAQNFWPQEIKEYTENWDTITDEDTAMLLKELEKETPQISTPVPSEETTVKELTPEEKAYDAEISQQNEEIFDKTTIPNLLIPGVSGGSITSLFGCRPRPCNGCSKTHKGIDAVATGKPCSPILAAGPGTITYQVQRKGSKVTGYGYYAIIDHGKISGNTWKTYYAHMTMSSGSPEGTRKQVRQGEKIGCMGNTGVGTGAHLHFGVYFNGKVNNKSINGYVDPLSLPAGQICTIEDSNCDGKNRKICNSSIIQQNPPSGQSIKSGGWPAAGQAVGLLTSSSDYNGSSSSGFDGGALITEIPDVKYTGPTNIMPKSVMNSLLGAMRVITNTVSEIKVLGNMIMCYSDVEGGGAWHWSLTGWDDHYTLNVFMWIEGAIIWSLGFLLVMAVAYYFLDISFKIGFAVLAIPLVMGLWPFGLTKDKLFIAISIIAKSSAMFAFMALTTYYGLELLQESFVTGGFTEEGGIYEIFDQVIDRSLETGTDQMNKLAQVLNDKLSLFSTSFIMLAFAVIYTYKLVQKTSSDLVNKFFPDKAFGDSSPMHSGATMMTDFAKKVGMSVTGANLARDVIANQTGKLVHGGLHKAGSAIMHPMKSGRAVKAKAGHLAGRAKNAMSNIASRIRGHK